MSIRYLIIALFLVGFATTYEINEKEVERILTILSSNKMEGRSLHSKGIKKAANFIANEFKTIGLTPLKENESFLQDFTMNSTFAEVDEVVINDIKLAKKDYFFKLSNEINWTRENKPQLLFIAASDNFREKAGEALGSSNDYLVIVDEVHKTVFSGYKSYFSRPNMSFESKDGVGLNLGFVLINTDKIEDISIKAKAKVDKQKLTNVVGVIPGKRSSEIVLFSAHYDHLGVGKNIEGDSIYNGANDDASGVTA
ncbi:MAG: M28 family peptidase, partial [Cyclobacteriaceae bacterium]|nr:M28 family peptidase [Cyclobacteriaceae bacterium]